jgi:hypothetical protein
VQFIRYLFPKRGSVVDAAICLRPAIGPRQHLAEARLRILVADVDVDLGLRHHEVADLVVSLGTEPAFLELALEEETADTAAPPTSSRTMMYLDGNRRSSSLAT